MATIKIKFRPSTIPDQPGAISYQIIHARKTRQISTHYRIHPSEWDATRQRIVISSTSDRQPYLLSLRDRIRWDLERLNRIIHNFNDSDSSYTAADIVAEFHRYAAEYSLFNYMQTQIIKLRRNARIRTAETYTAALNSFRRFRQGEDVMLDNLNSAMMEAYEAWHQQRGVTPNTISFYNRILRAVYNRAVEEEIIDNRYPFRHVYTGVDKTVKRALPLSMIKKIRLLDLSLTPSLDFARDMFMMSFFLRGMSFIDMAYLRKTDLHNGYITYRRRKTGQQLTIEWTTEMQTLLDKYPENDSDYLLPIIRNSATNERYVYRNVGYNINHNLKQVARLAHIAIPLTLYVARHSWASAAKAKGIPLSIISEGLGHDSETTTQIYLASLDTSLIDKANSLILKSL